jgi:hypothetical protein
MVILRKVLNNLADAEALAAVAEATKVNFHHFTRMFESV